MGEAKRRGRTLKVLGTVNMTLEEYKKIPSVCAWGGCEKTFTGDMPLGWVWLLAYWRKTPAVNFLEIGWNDQRDCALCPEHMRELDALLKVVPDRRLRQTAGSKQ